MRKTTQTVLEEEIRKGDEAEKQREEVLLQFEKQKEKKRGHEKQGFMRWNAKPMWFVVINGSLSFFKTPADEVPKGSVPLLLCTVKEVIYISIYMYISAG